MLLQAKADAPSSNTDSCPQATLLLGGLKLTWRSASLMMSQNFWADPCVDRIDSTNAQRHIATAASVSACTILAHQPRSSTPLLALASIRPPSSLLLGFQLASASMCTVGALPPSCTLTLRHDRKRLSEWCTAR